MTLAPSGPLRASTATPPPGCATERSERSLAWLRDAAATSDLVRRARLLDRVVEVNLCLADGLAARYAGRGIPSDDLVQVARLGLVRAAHRFDPDAGAEFAAFAVPTIRGELRKHFRDCGWMVRPPRALQELQSQVAAAADLLSQRLGAAPTVAQLASHLGLSEDRVIEGLATAGSFSPSSLDLDLGEDRAGTLGESLGELDPAFDESEARLVLTPLLRRLGPRDRLVLRLRFADGLTQREVGERIGVSQMQVSRILSRVLATLRTEIQQSPEDGADSGRTPPAAEAPKAPGVSVGS
jgi:RNA polymerase sigma-B factor